MRIEKRGDCNITPRLHLKLQRRITYEGCESEVDVGRKHQENLMEMTRHYNPWQIKHMQFLALFGAYLGLLVENNNKE